MVIDNLPMREELCQTGVALSNQGLVARTWGNLSIRITSDKFIISPSGIFYQDTEPKHLSLVNISDGKWVGDFKPSSEKSLHACIYAQDNNISAIIHTHQIAASAVAAARVTIGNNITLAKYALPTTGTLAKYGSKAFSLSKPFIKGSSARAVLLANHGTIIAANSMKEAFDAAIELEKIATEFVKSKFVSTGSLLSKAYKSAQVANFESKLYKRLDTNRPKLIDELFNTREDLNFILHSKEPNTYALSETGLTLKPLLDDLAQLIGTKVGSVNVSLDSHLPKNEPGSRNAFFLKGNGALCFAETKLDVYAVQLVLEKGSRSLIDSEILGGGHRISLLESFLMRFIYKKKYSKMSLNTKEE
ncbi:MAG: class II aldolase/adducin family protein [Spirochaetaceae bacterium]